MLPMNLDSPDQIKARMVAAHYLEPLGIDASLRLAEEIERALRWARANELRLLHDENRGGHDLPDLSVLIERAHAIERAGE